MGFFLLSGVAAAFPTSAQTPAAPLVVSNYVVTLTAYNAVPAQTDEDPFTTASGAYSNPEIIAARSQDLRDEFPFGTIIELDGAQAENDSCGYHIVKPIIGYRIIADTMNVRFTNRLDVLFDTKSNYIMADGREMNAGNVLGICTGVSVRVVGYLDGSRPGKFPKTQEELARLVKSGAPLAVR